MSRSPADKQKLETDASELMYVQCAYCGAWLDVTPGRMNQISHTICETCLRRVLQADRLRRSKSAKG